MPTANGAIPVESILKLTLDKTGAQTIQDFLDKQEKSWGSVEQYVGKISSHLEGMTRFGLGLAGIAGVGAVVQNFMATSQAGSNVALAAGRVTGGVGAWHPYGQALLGAQAATGVGATEIGQGLIMAVQSVGGNPSPQQAAVLGGLLAGYGQTVGMSPAQVAQVIAPILQAANKPLTAGGILGAGASLSGTLTAFPGSQAAPMLPLISSLAVSQALGSGPAHGFATDPHGLAALVNAAAMTNSIFRNPSVAGSATGSISGGLQNAYGNPSMEAFLQRAGIGYWQQRQGITPTNAQAIMREATSMYGTGITRDLALRSMFGLQGADMLEALSTPAGQRNLHDSLAHHGSPGHLLNQLHHAQARTTPGATGNRLGAGILHWLESSPLHALLGLGGAWAGKQALQRLPGLLGRGLGRLAGSGAEDAAGSTLAEVLGSGALDLVSGAAAFLTAPGGVVFPDSAGGAGDRFSPHAFQQFAVRNVLQMGLRRYGPHGVKSAAARNYMEGLLYANSSSSVWGVAAMDRYGGHPGAALHGASGQLLDQVLGDPYARAKAAAGGQDPTLLFAQAAKELFHAAQVLERGPWSKLTSATPGNQSQYVGLGVGGIQGLGAAAPGMEFAALTGGGGGGGAFVGYPGGGQPVAFTRPSSTGGGGQACTLTWYDPALGGINGGGTYAGGGQYHASDMACAAPPQYPFGTQIKFTYGSRSITCTVRDRGGAITGQHFDLTRGAFTALVGSTAAGVVHATFQVVGHASANRPAARNGGGGGGAPGGGSSVLHAAGDAGAVMAAAGTHPAAAAAHHHHHVHVYVDGREMRQHRVLLGHKR